MTNEDRIVIPFPSDESIGSFHPISSTIREISLVLNDLGFSEASGPEIESEKFNFDIIEPLAELMT